MKVYCEECKYVGKLYIEEQCKYKNSTEKRSEKNKNNDCNDFTKET